LRAKFSGDTTYIVFESDQDIRNTELYYRRNLHNIFTQYAYTTVIQKTSIEEHYRIYFI
jgi:hypothetical protein